MVGTSTSSISNCYATGDVFSFSNDSSSAIGGLVGRNTGSNIENCYATGNIFSFSGPSNSLHNYSYAGGVVGESRSTSSISNCYATGNVSSFCASSECYAGGVVGYCYTQFSINIVENCYATGNVSVSAPGGMAGGVVGWSYSKVENCYRLRTANITINGIERQEGTKIGTPLTAVEMTGIGDGRASEKMENFDLSIWTFKDDEIVPINNEKRKAYFPSITNVTVEPLDTLLDFLSSHIDVTINESNGNYTASYTKKEHSILEINDEDISYQWYIESENGDGTYDEIENETESNYTMKEEDLGKTLKVEVSSNKTLGKIEKTIVVKRSVQNDDLKCFYRDESNEVSFYSSLTKTYDNRVHSIDVCPKTSELFSGEDIIVRYSKKVNDSFRSMEGNAPIEPGTYRVIAEVLETEKVKRTTGIVLGELKIEKKPG